MEEKTKGRKRHIVVDVMGNLLSVVVHAANIHDTKTGIFVAKRASERYPSIQKFCADAAYKGTFVSDVDKQLCLGVDTSEKIKPHEWENLPWRWGVERTLSWLNHFRRLSKDWWAYVYDEYYNCIICPEYQPLKFSTTNWDRYREYKSAPKICAQCPTWPLCTRSKDCIKTVQRHIWKDYEELTDDARYTPEYRELYAKRKETIERVFAGAKKNTPCVIPSTVVWPRFPNG